MGGPLNAASEGPIVGAEALTMKTRPTLRPHRPFTFAVLAIASRPARSQIVTTFAGSGKAGLVDGRGEAAAFSGPSGVAVDPYGNVYVSDTLNVRIRRITADGDVTTVDGSGGAS